MSLSKNLKWNLSSRLKKNGIIFIHMMISCNYISYELATEIF